ncbi:MAG: response regulator [Deltaproteobacteria bacterium]|nr:response regulator [Deltaproteobacteria bacterium]
MQSISALEKERPLVLIVDDDFTIRLLMREALEQAGFLVVEAGNGPEALALFARQLPEIVLLDVIMPDVDGFTICAALRQLPGGARIPVVMVTGLDDLDSINRAYEVGATDFITKPIVWPILGHRVHYILRSSRAMEELHDSQAALRQAHDELELRVQERTTELAHTNRALHAEITERKRTEEALQEAHQRLRFHVENSPLAVVESDNEFRVQGWSSQAEHMFGWKAEEVVGKQPTEWRFIPPEEKDTVSIVIRELLTGHSPRTVSTNQNYRKDGSTIDCEWYNSALIDEHGRLISVLSLVQDVTERKALERLKDELVSTVSHELRTPLASLRGFAELMLTRHFSLAQQREFLTIILNESKRLADLINDFLDLQRIEAGRQEYHFKPLDLLSVVRETIAIFQANSNGIAIRLLKEPTLPPVHADADRLRQVLLNLLSNAVKFSPHGGEITIGTRQEGADVVVWIRDQGIGIAPDTLPKLFTKFFRANTKEIREISGTGLGLALVKRIITAHGGQIWVESALGKGSTFFFTLPAVAATPALLRPNGGVVNTSPHPLTP